MPSRARTACLAAATAVAAVAAPGLAGQTGPTGSPGPGYIKTSNVEHVLTLPLDTDSIGARVFEGLFYVRTAKGVTIYDTADPVLPTPKGFVAVPATPNQEREDIDTNGEILVTGQSIDGVLYVIDVRNKTTPTLLSTLQRAADHTNTCVLDCRYVYGSEGTIVDLTDPKAPKLAGSWLGRGTDAALAGVSGSHDLTEVEPGLLVTASNPVLWIDARENPTQPVVLAKGELPDKRYMHGMEWPRGGQDRFLLGGSETTDLGCQSDQIPGTFVVWDTAAVAEQVRQPDYEQPFETPVFTRTGQYKINKGLPTDMKGQFPASQHCAHWFDPNPQFADGGLVAMAWYTYGVRFLEVLGDGTVEERGFWQPLPGVSSAAFWVSDDVVWVTDYTGRGIDVLRFNSDAPAEVDAAAPGEFVAAGSAEEARGAALVNAFHRTEHHAAGSVAEIADAWVCKPVGAPAPQGRPVLGQSLLR